MAMLRALWADEAGFVISAELILVATIAVLGSVVGLSAVSTSVNGELLDVAGGFDALNQGDRYPSLADGQSRSSLADAEIVGEGG